MEYVHDPAYILDKKLSLPPQDELLRRYDYCPATGAVYNKKTGKLLTGGDGYMRVTIDYVQYKLHRVIWKMMTGEEPDIIDHINNDHRDNSWANLRSCTKSQNCCNRASRNIYPRGNKFRVKVNKTFIGTYSTLEEAVKVRNKALTKYHGEFANYGHTT